MWSENTGDANIEGGGGQIQVFKILNGHEHMDPNIYIFVTIKTGNITR